MDTDSVRIVEVGPRDGLQNVKSSIPTSTKVELITRLRDAGLQTIELTSLVSSRIIPQLSDARQILSDATLQPLRTDSTNGLQFPVLVPNMRGLQVAIEHGVREIAVFVSASDGFSKANINCSVSESLIRAREVVKSALLADMQIRGYVSCIFEDPYEGLIPSTNVVRVVRELLEMGCHEVSLGDTMGVGTPRDVEKLLDDLHEDGIPIGKLAGHFHDTYGQSLANIWQAYRLGMRCFDSSVAGLGGCPYCPGARGNAATEDVVFMFQRAGIDTGVDLSKLAAVGAWISRVLHLPNGSRAGSALSAKQSIVDEADHPTSQQEKSYFLSHITVPAVQIFRISWAACHALVLG